jgi:hypothetical protein
MKKSTALVTVVAFACAVTPAANAWISYLDFNDSAFPPDPPWTAYFNEGSAAFVELGVGNMALRLDSPDHSAEDPPEGTYYNEYYITDIPGYEKVVASRFRLHSFTPTGKENIIAPSTPVSAPSITLVDGRYKIWSFLSDQSDPVAREILDLGPAVVDQFHEVYIMTTIEGTDGMGVPNAGGAKVWWDGSIVFDGPVDGGANVPVGGYVEFGSGTYWQVNAGTEVDFDWVGFGDVNDFPGVAGDYNGNAVVDAADYVLWRHGGPLQHEVADPGIVSPADYAEWRSRFGNTSVSGSAMGRSAVPEPAIFGLLLIAALANAARRTR